MSEDLLYQNVGNFEVNIWETKKLKKSFSYEEEKVTLVIAAFCI